MAEQDVVQQVMNSPAPHKWGTSGHRANYGPGSREGGFATPFGYLKRAASRKRKAEQHTAPGGMPYGITCLAPTNEWGKPIANPQEYELEFQGRQFRPNNQGVFKICDTSAFNGEVADALDYDSWLVKYSGYAKAGNLVFEKIFGTEALKACQAFKTDRQILPNGVEIAEGLRGRDCSPDIIRQYPGTSDEFSLLLAKLMRIRRSFQGIA